MILSPATKSPCPLNLGAPRFVPGTCERAQHGRAPMRGPDDTDQVSRRSHPIQLILKLIINSVEAIAISYSGHISSPMRRPRRRPLSAVALGTSQWDRYDSGGGAQKRI